jgi:hypothetical protein
MANTSWEQLLGDQASYLLEFNQPKINKSHFKNILRNFGILTKKLLTLCNLFFWRQWRLSLRLIIQYTLYKSRSWNGVNERNNGTQKPVTIHRNDWCFLQAKLVQNPLSPLGNLLYKTHIFIFPKTFLEKPILDIYKCPFSDFPKRSWLKKVKKCV